VVEAKVSIFARMNHNVTKLNPTEPKVIHNVFFFILKMFCISHKWVCSMPSLSRNGKVIVMRKIDCNPRPPPPHPAPFCNFLTPCFTFMVLV